MAPRTEADATAELALAGTLVNPDTPAVLAPAGFTLLTTEHLADTPRRPTGIPTVLDLASFVDYTNRLATPAALVVADPDQLLLLALFDADHRSGETPDPTPDDGDATALVAGAVVPGWRQHGVQWSLSVPPETQAWLDADGTWMDHARFAEFIEQNAKAIRTPAGAQVLEAVREFKAARSVQFGGTVGAGPGGDVSFSFTSETKGAGQVHFPEVLTLGLVPFVGSEAYAVEARTRYDLVDGRLRLRVELFQYERVRDDAWRDLVAKVRTDTGLQVVTGRAATFRR